MSADRHDLGVWAARTLIPLCAAACLLNAKRAGAQGVGFTRQRPFVIAYEPVIGADGSVGGVRVDAEGVVSSVTTDIERPLTEVLASFSRPIPGELSERVPLRKISLARLEAALADSVRHKRPLADEIRYLGGLQRIEYVFVYPDEQDIVLAGPAEGWKVSAEGFVVGSSTQQAVMLLDDLLVALRNVRLARAEGVSCSIEPTAEGRRACDAVMRRQRHFSPQVLPAIQRALGDQQILLTGVPATSHLAQVLVASDYRMKRIAMNLEPSPVDELASYLELLQSSDDVPRTMTPRWWLAADYEPLAMSDDGLAWQLRGRRVKAMTEDDLVARDGRVVGSGRASPVAQRWADAMTAHYDPLALERPVFGQLRNVIDLCVVAALIDRYDLVGRAGCRLPELTRVDSHLGTCELNAPRKVATQCSFVKRTNDWVITASGGVEIDGWQIVERRQRSNEAASQRNAAAPPATAGWWWN